MNLTEKQQYQRQYYQKNRETICAKKRKQYTRKTQLSSLPEQKRKTRATSPNIAAPAPATCPVKLVNKMPEKTRHRIEDIQLARELGISVDEL